MAVKVGMVSLGCSKNQVDAELMLALIVQGGYELCADAQACDVVIINTCGFIEDAKRESIETILEFAQMKEAGKIKAVVVTGCLAERYREQVAMEIPEADVVLGIGRNAEIIRAIEDALAGKRTVAFGEKDALPQLYYAENFLVNAILAGRRSFSMPMQLLGYFLGTMFFGMLFGGTLRDGICSGICGVALGGCLTFMTRLGANLFFKTIAGGAVSALLALLLTWAGLGQNSDFVIIGALMALVPGLIFTNAIRDIMAGDMVSGITRAAEALLIGVAIALGTGFVLTAARMLGGM